MYSIVEYKEEKQQEWDDFVMNKSYNGTFLQSRNFLNYHPKGRFDDCSVLIYDEKGALCAVCPACRLKEGNKNIFYSHKGSTFGGIVISRKGYRVMCVLPMIEQLIRYWEKEQFDVVYLKNTSDIFSQRRNDLLSYALFYHGFHEYKELSSYIDFDDYKDVILSNFAQGKRTHVNNCIREGLIFTELTSCDEITSFYQILCENLQKHNIRPVHTLEEMMDLKNRLGKQCGIYGCYMGGEMVAGTMLFYFEQAKTAHAQYLAAKLSLNRLSPMSFLYYSVIKEMKEKGYCKVSWGISTEDKGTFLNMGLVTNKEAVGSRFCNNLTYFMEV